MIVTDVHIFGFRSIKSIRFPVQSLSVLLGGNGTGKTNLYRSLQLLQAAATGTLAQEIAGEGGLQSVFWAGERRVDEKPRLILEIGLRENGGGGHKPARFTYRIEIGFPNPISDAAFNLEAQVKLEAVTAMIGGRNVVLMERKGPSVWARGEDGSRVVAEENLLASETALSRMMGASGFPEIDALRHALSQWRFYHGFRTDAESPLRRPALPVTSPTLASDGSNLAGVFATLRHIRGDTVDLDRAIGDAFPGAELLVEMPLEDARFSMRFPDLPKRPFAAPELSDGTLQFLALCGALLAYRLPPFIALNEPEASLHPDLLPALARIIAEAANRTQVWVVTHSRELADALAQESGSLPREVTRKDGSTWIEGLNQLGLFDDD